MTRAEFMAELERQLAALPDAERKDALEYYEEYFDAAGPEKEAATAAELGSPEDVARKILEEQGAEISAAKPEAEHKKPETDGRSPFFRLSRKIKLAMLLLLIVIIIVLLLLNFGTRGLSKTEAEQSSSAETAADTPVPENISVDAASEGAYKWLLGRKTDGYEKMSVEEFNASLSAGNHDLDKLMEVRSTVAASLDPTSDGYDYFNYTLDYSLLELYYKQLNADEYSFTAYLERTHAADAAREAGREYAFAAPLNITYSIKNAAVTVAERDNALNTLRKEMQVYVDSLPEDELLDSAASELQNTLDQKAQELAQRLDTESLSLSCNIGGIARDIVDTAVPEEYAEAAVYDAEISASDISGIGLPLEEVQKLYVSLGVGNLRIVADDTAETASFLLENFDTEKVQIKFGGGACVIGYHPLDAKAVASVGAADGPMLTITLPSNMLSKLELNCGTGNCVIVGAFKLQSFKAYLDTGMLDAAGLNAEETDVDALSYTLNLAGRESDYYIETASPADIGGENREAGYSANETAKKHVQLKAAAGSTPMVSFGAELAG